jgi:hypothetical protein
MYGPQQRRMGEPLPHGQEAGREAGREAGWVREGERVDMTAIIRHFPCLSQARWVFRIGKMQGRCVQLVQLRLKIAEHK